MHIGIAWSAGFCTLLVALIVSASGSERIPLSTPLEDCGFESLGSKDGVAVFKHPIKSVVRTAGESFFLAPPREVRDVLIDYKRQVGRVGRVSEVEILEKSANHLLVYQRLNLPVISDRDYNIVVTWGEKDGVTWIEYHAVKDRGKQPVSGVVRVTHHSGSWQLESRGHPSKTFARFQVSLDVAGLVPLWLVRSGAAKELPRLFFEIGEILKNDK